jgi:hypothetical protein
MNFYHHLCTPGQTSRSITHAEIALSQACLILEFFSVGLPEKKVYLGGMSILSIILSLEPECHRLKKSSPCLRSLNAYVSNCKQIGHCSGLLHGDLLHSLDITDSITESIDDLYVMYVQDDVPGIVETFHVVCTQEIPDEYGTQLLPGVDRSLG